MVEDIILFLTCKFLLSNVIVIEKEYYIGKGGESGTAIRRSFNTGDHKDTGL